MIVHVLSEEDAVNYIDVSAKVIINVLFYLLGTFYIPSFSQILLAWSTHYCHESKRYSTKRMYDLFSYNKSSICRNWDSWIPLSCSSSFP